jgi:hypothetical protein
MCKPYGHSLNCDGIYRKQDHSHGFQLYDNSVYLVGGPGGEKHHPIWDARGTYHIDGPLVVADLTKMLWPLIKALGGVKKLILSPVSHYWMAPSSNAESHLKTKTTITCPVYLRVSMG